MNLERSKTGNVDILWASVVLASASERTLSQGDVTVNLGVGETSGAHGFVLGEFVSELDPGAVGARIWLRGRRSIGRSACAT